MGGAILIQAVLNGKSLGYEYSEDFLTSSVFGLLTYLRPEMALIPFIETAYLYDTEKTTLWKKLNSDGIELRCYREIEQIFWARHIKPQLKESEHQSYTESGWGEPDLILIFRDHVHGLDDLLLVVESKFQSGKSGKDEKDQLLRYYEAINDLENFTEPLVSNFCGMKGYIIYLTEFEAYSEISDSIRLIKKKYGITPNIFQLKWDHLYQTLEKVYSFFSSYEIEIVNDLMKYMEKLGLRGFSGISLPDDFLASVFTSSYPIFYH